MWVGLIVLFVVYFGIFMVIYVNCLWWRLIDNVISDFGKFGFFYNWFFNVLFVIMVVLVIYYVFGVFDMVRNSVEKVGIWVFIVGFVFLVLIGIFLEGILFYYYVSWGFFLMVGFGFLIVGIGMGFLGDRKMLYFMVVLFVLVWIFVIWVMRIFKGVVILEFIGVLVVMIWYYVVFLKIWGKIC